MSSRKCNCYGVAEDGATVVVRLGGEDPVLPIAVLPPKLVVARFENGASRTPEALDRTYLALEKLYRNGLHSQVIETLLSVGSKLLTTDRGRMLLARSLTQQGRHDVAQRWCECLIAYEPLAAGHHHMLGCVFTEARRHVDAHAALRDALDLEADFVMAHVAMAHLASLRGRESQARRHYHRALGALQLLPDDCYPPFSEGMSARMLRAVIVSAVSQSCRADAA